MTGPSDYIFYALAAMTVGSAVLVAVLPNIIYAAVALLFSFAGVAGLYVLLSADFLAATQVLVARIYATFGFRQPIYTEQTCNASSKVLPSSKLSSSW